MVDGCVDVACYVMGEVEAATQKWRNRQIKREKRTARERKNREQRGGGSKRFRKNDLAGYHYKDSLSKQIIIPVYQSFCDYLENMTAASSAVEEYVPRFNTFLWFTTRGNGVTAQQLIDVLTDDTHRNEWYAVCVRVR